MFVARGNLEVRGSVSWKENTYLPLSAFLVHAYLEDLTFLYISSKCFPPTAYWPEEYFTITSI